MKTKMFTDEVIDLSGETPIGVGSTRRVYLFPERYGAEYAGKCIKTEPWEVLLEHRKNHRQLFKRIRGAKRLGETPYELTFYRWAENRDTEIFNCVPRFYGMVRTNFGDAMVQDYIRGKTIYNFIHENGITPFFTDALKKLLRAIIENAIEFRDVNGWNNWLVQEAPDGQLRIFLVDGLGSATLIPLTRWFSSIRNQTVRRRVGRMLNGMRRHFAGCDNLHLLDFELW
jgi:hypothetical protein